MSDTKQKGKITRVNYGVEDHGILTSWVFVEFDGGGSQQGFGGLVFSEETGPAWKQSIADLFGVKTFGEIIGRKCWALRSFPIHNEPIEGLETLKGKRFTITQFRRRWHPGEYDGNVLDDRIKSYKQEIVHHERRITWAKEAIDRAASEFVDWNKP